MTENGYAGERPKRRVNPRVRCEGLRKDGVPCQAPRLKDSQFCSGHDERYRQRSAENMTRGRQEKARLRREGKLREKEYEQVIRTWDARRFTSLAPAPNLLAAVPVIETITDMKQYLCELVPYLSDRSTDPKRIGMIMMTVKHLLKIFEIEGANPEATTVKLAGMDGEEGEDIVTEGSTLDLDGVTVDEDGNFQAGEENPPAE